MRAKKTTLKIVALIVALGILTLGIWVFIFMAVPEILWKESRTYRNTDSEEMIVYVADRYALKFPEGITDIKAAKTMTSWDGWSSFALRFQIGSKDIDAFLMNFNESLINFKPYNKNNDERLTENYPEWFKSEITKGRMGSVRVQAAKVPNVSFKLNIYFDLTDAETCIIFLRGTYKSDAG